MRNKSYIKEKSPFYKLSNKRRLCELLNTSLGDVNKLLTKDNYKIYYKYTQGKKRQICEPKKQLKYIQKRIQRFLSRIETPEYLFSGKKGLCYVDNAKHHKNSKFIVDIDICSFYPCCKHENIFRFFHFKFLMPDDVAWFITDLVTFDNYLPTGSPTSQLLAFFAYEDMFSEIYDYSVENNFRVSVFVDDISFSSNNYISKTLPYSIKKIVNKYKHSINEKKTNVYFPSNYKKITGCIISPDNELKVPNRLRKDIVDGIGTIKKQYIKNPKKVYSMLGKIQSAQQIEPMIFENSKSYLVGLGIPNPYN